MPEKAIAQAQKEQLVHEIITLNIQKQANTNDIKNLTEWLEFIHILHFLNKLVVGNAHPTKK
ncbi:hypothetical protein [Anabaena azotica]|uniref:Uncharacterized protein n=1 Tax=Anabaena azotica FACHB-119 TaxID=947527 RepID=A0ABR8DCA4_9NOST|nr:hypothetical protein [Anabaena azotica]MBD2504827.1 hypothetical protein [Anabaena azotica FACHB-119]